LLGLLIVIGERNHDRTSLAEGFVDVELIRIQQINDAYERLLKSDVKYRFVIDMTSMD
jgi:hypothetical protein